MAQLLNETTKSPQAKPETEGEAKTFTVVDRLPGYGHVQLQGTYTGPVTEKDVKDRFIITTLAVAMLGPATASGAASFTRINGTREMTERPTNCYCATMPAGLTCHPCMTREVVTEMIQSRKDRLAYPIRRTLRELTVPTFVPTETVIHGRFSRIGRGSFCVG